jgi:steroid 5-alpha reductase family enzyme
VSPFFVSLLILKVSGVPLLEEKSRRLYGHREDYRAYCARTPLLVPLPHYATFSKYFTPNRNSEGEGKKRKNN